MYSNRKSLNATYGEDEVDGLADDDVKFNKATKQAYDEINSYLTSGGYATPLVFTDFGGTPTVDLPLLDGRVQAISDSFTAWYLAKGTDLSKKVYEDDRAEGLKWLEAVRVGEVRPLFPRTTTPTGSGEAVTLARPRVFDTDMRTANALFCRNRR
jgi:hypothetical protein